MEMSIEIEMVHTSRIQEYLAKGYFIDRMRSAYPSCPNDFLLVTKDAEIGSIRLNPENLGDHVGKVC
jgi:hypothetical protein